MENAKKKDFNAMMNNNKNMPKIVELDEAGAKKWGGKNMVIAPPLDYNALMKNVPNGKLITITELRKAIAKKYNVEITCPLTAGIFVNIVAWASYQRNTDVTPFWRTLKSNGELNVKYPETIDFQKRKLEEEGHIIITKGKTNKRYFVKDFENSLIELNE